MLIVHFRNNILLITISLYLLLNYGFMLVRIPPIANAGVPVGELVLLLSLATLNHFKLLSKLFSVIFFFPLILWWTLGLTRAAIGVQEYGFWALRDATHVIESLFLIVGFAFASRELFVERFFKWVPFFFIAAFLYGLSYLFWTELVLWSPTLTAGAGHQVPLFFNYLNTPAMLLWAASYYLIFYRNSVIGAKFGWVIAVFLIGYSTFIFQSRIIYLQIISIFFLFIFYRRELVGKGVAGFLVLISALFLISIIGFQIKGRLGQEVSFGFLINHFLAIGGIISEGVEGSALGVYLRLGWWLDLYHKWTSGIGTFFFGLGYGFPLVDFIAFGPGYAESGQLVREPHNSYISTIARIGLVGFGAWVWFHSLLFWKWNMAYRKYQRLGNSEYQNRLLFLMVYFVLMLVFAIGEDAFEKPFVTIPYYFFWGMILRFIYQLKSLNKNNIHIE